MRGESWGGEGWMVGVGACEGVGFGGVGGWVGGWVLGFIPGTRCYIKVAIFILPSIIYVFYIKTTTHHPGLTNLRCTWTLLLRYFSSKNHHATKVKGEVLHFMKYPCFYMYI